MSETQRDDAPGGVNFEEEKACLKELERTIDGIIEPISNKVKEYDRELRDWHPIGNDEIQSKQWYISKRNMYQDQLEYFKSYKPEPYFCHFEASLSGEDPQSYYVGKRALVVQGDLIVLDWRSPLGRTIQNKTQTKFRIEPDGGGNPVTYDLHLRRMVTIENGVLKLVNTEYDPNSIGLEGDVIDPFLVSVLKDQRRNHRVTDIIKTIQQNQIRIVELPVDESFIIQGCAGSGKTMILLHRLSYLVFNHKDVDFSKYVIITPNESFNRYIDQLCEELDLGDIPRYTPEGYYGHIVEKKGRIDTYIHKKTSKSAGTARPKLLPIEGPLRSDESLSESFLKVIYSEEFLSDVANFFDDLGDIITDRLRADGALEMLKDRGLLRVGEDSTAYEFYRNLVTAAESIRREADEALREREAARKRLDSIEKKFEAVKKPYDDAVAIMQPFRQRVLNNPISILQAPGSMRDELEDKENAAKLELSRIKDRLERIAEDEKLCSRTIATLERDLLALQASEVSLDARENSLVNARVDEACVAQRAEILRIEDELKKVGPFALGKRRRLRADLTAAQEAYDSAREHAVDSIANVVIADLEREKEEREADLKHKIGAACRLKERIEQEFAHMVEEEDIALSLLSEATSLLDDLDKRAEMLEPFFAMFESVDFPKPPLDVDLEFMQEAAPALAEYVSAYNKLTLAKRDSLESGCKRIAQLETELQDARSMLTEAESRVLDEGGVAALSSIESASEELDVRSYDKKFVQYVDALAKEHGINSLDGGPYRFQSFLRALECMTYYGPIANEVACVCIDEAQDFSSTELRIIRSSLGESAVVNLYGDTHQSVYGYKGISDWKDVNLGEVLSTYYLNENYRNTVQINDFCNEQLQMEVTSVGLSGDDVFECDLAEGIEALRDLLRQDPSSRCAVIGTREELARQRVGGFLAGSSISWGDLTTGKISAISVDAAKGLEFEAVLVLEQDMGYNERYVAYTRALNSLYIVKAPFCKCLDLESSAANSASAQGTASGVGSCDPSCVAIADYSSNEIRSSSVSDFEKIMGLFEVYGCDNDAKQHSDSICDVVNEGDLGLPDGVDEDSFTADDANGLESDSCDLDDSDSFAADDADGLDGDECDLRIVDYDDSDNDSDGGDYAFRESISSLIEQMLKSSSECQNKVDDR